MSKLSGEQLRLAERFTERIAAAIAETGVKLEHGYGFVLGWVYGQLCRQYSQKEVRIIFEELLKKFEAEFDADGSKN